MKKGNEIKKLKKELMELKEELIEQKEEELKIAKRKKLVKLSAKKPKAKKDVFADQLKPSMDWGY